MKPQPCAHVAAQVEETLIVVSTSIDDHDPADHEQQGAPAGALRGRLIVYKLNCYPSPPDALNGPAQEGAAPHSDTQ